MRTAFVIRYTLKTGERRYVTPRRPCPGDRYHSEAVLADFEAAKLFNTKQAAMRADLPPLPRGATREVVEAQVIEPAP